VPAINTTDGVRAVNKEQNHRTKERGAAPGELVGSGSRRGGFVSTRRRAFGEDGNPQANFRYVRLSPANPTREVSMIAVLSETFRGVLCRRCEKPIRVPEKIESRRGPNALSGRPDKQYLLVSQTFVLRYRACQKESGLRSQSDYGLRSRPEIRIAAGNRSKARSPNPEAITI
jgi:hypothetical protein